MPKMPLKYIFYSFLTVSFAAWLGVFGSLAVLLGIWLISRVCEAILRSVWQILIGKGEAFDYLTKKQF